LLLNIASGISELFSLVVIMPFLEILTSPAKEIMSDNLPLGNIIDFSFLDSSTENRLLISTILVIKVIFVTSVIRVANLYLNSRISGLIGTDFSTSLFKVILDKPYTWHIKNNSSSSISTTTFQTDQMVTGIKALLMSFTAIVVMFSITVSLFLISYKITIFCIIIIGFIYLSMSIATKKVLSKSSKWITQNDKLRIKILQEGIGNIRDVILNSNGYYFINRFHKANRKTRLANANIQFLSSYPRFLLESLSIMFIVLIAFYLQKSNPNENNVLPVLGTLALGMQRLLPSAQVFYSGYVSLKGNSVSIMSVLEKLNVPKVYAKRENVNFNNFKSIEIKNLSYKYPLKSDNILKNITFSINRGEKVGIIGPTGCGKTTLINIFMGLLRPDSGDIIIDDKNIFETKTENYWSKYIAHVPQNIFLSDNSIAENIAFGLDKNEIDLLKVINASKKAQLHEFIISKKLGYQTNIGELGIKLSGGQRQRIAIARALYKNVNFLILDEATSALDTNCENILMEEIYRLKDISMIMIAHRLSTLSKCDKIIELKEGELANIYTGDSIKEIIQR
tara:strand:- start:5315 stop:7009 length:1695 start_codon:yes stop_codon:yes gene_type:complete